MTVGWQFEPRPFPIGAAIAGLIAGLQLLGSDEVLRAYEPIEPMVVTLGLVNWPAAGITGGDLWGLPAPRPSMPLQRHRRSQKFTVSPDMAPWPTVKAFLPYILGDAGYLGYEPYLEKAPPYQALGKFCEMAGVHIV